MIYDILRKFVFIVILTYWLQKLANIPIHRKPNWVIQYQCDSTV